MPSQKLETAAPAIEDAQEDEIEEAAERLDDVEQSESIAEVAVGQPEEPVRPEEPEPVAIEAEPAPVEPEPEAVVPVAEQQAGEPQPAGKPNKQPSRGLIYLRNTGIIVALIAVAVALLSALNLLTGPVANADAGKELQNEMESIFGGGIVISASDMSIELPVRQVYQVSRDGERLGYGVAVSPEGFKGPVDLLVGVDTAGKVLGVEILASNETPAIEAKVADPAFLAQFAGKSWEIGLNTHGGVDAVSGATVSCKTIVDGVNAALQAVDSDASQTATTLPLTAVPPVTVASETSPPPASLPPETSMPVVSTVQPAS